MKWLSSAFGWFSAPFYWQWKAVVFNIIYEFLLIAAESSERNDLLELMEFRTNRNSTIFCSQWTPEGWHEKLGAEPVADAVLDRIVNSSYTIQLQGNSMWEEYSRLKKWLN